MSVEPLEGGGVYVVHGDFYAAEKILDRKFMRMLHAELGEELLAVAIPIRGRMFVTAGVQEPNALGRFCGLARAVHDNEPVPITPHVFGVVDGEVTAVIVPTPAEPQQKKSFWRRLFG